MEGDDGRASDRQDHEPALRKVEAEGSQPEKKNEQSEPRAGGKPRLPLPLTSFRILDPRLHSWVRVSREKIREPQAQSRESDDGDVKQREDGVVLHVETQVPCGHAERRREERRLQELEQIRATQQRRDRGRYPTGLQASAPFPRLIGSCRTVSRAGRTGWVPRGPKAVPGRTGDRIATLRTRHSTLARAAQSRLGPVRRRTRTRSTGDDVPARRTSDPDPGRAD